MTSKSVNFDCAAGFYDDTRGFPPGENVRIAQLIADTAKLQTGSRALEIGVGTGRIALPLSQHVQAMHGIDISQLMLQRLLEKRGDEPVYPVKGDATHLPYASNSFDAVIAVHVFHLIPDLDATLAELARVLRPAGVLLRCWNRGNSPLDNLYEIWNKIVPRDTYRNYDRANNHLNAGGWRQDGGEHTYSFTIQITPQTWLDNLRQRVWSSTWRLSDEAMERGIAVLESTIHERFESLTMPVTVEEIFTVVVYAPPEMTNDG
jgi:SAM-dependent methyltransferase